MTALRKLASTIIAIDDGLGTQQITPTLSESLIQPFPLNAVVLAKYVIIAGRKAVLPADSLVRII